MDEKLLSFSDSLLFHKQCCIIILNCGNARIGGNKHLRVHLYGEPPLRGGPINCLYIFCFERRAWLHISVYAGDFSHFWERQGEGNLLPGLWEGEVKGGVRPKIFL